MDTNTVTQPAPPATRELRALQLYRHHGDDIHKFGTGLYRVPSSAGPDAGYYTVNYLDEWCTCPDHQRRGENCKHLLAVGIYHAKHRIHPEVAAGDPFAYAGRGECPACYRGVVYLTYEEDGHTWEEPVPCRRCQR